MLLFEAPSLNRMQIRKTALGHRVRSVRVVDSALLGDNAAGSDPDLLAEPARGRADMSHTYLLRKPIQRQPTTG